MNRWQFGAECKGIAEEKHPSSHLSEAASMQDRFSDATSAQSPLSPNATAPPLEESPTAPTTAGPSTAGVATETDTETTSEGDRAPEVDSDPAGTTRSEQQPSVLEAPAVPTADPAELDCTCVICFENGGDHVLLPCGHGAYCRACAHRLLAKSSASRHCPICRASFHAVVQINLSAPLGASAPVLSAFGTRIVKPRGVEAPPPSTPPHGAAGGLQLSEAAVGTPGAHPNSFEAPPASVPPPGAAAELQMAEAAALYPEPPDESARADSSVQGVVVDLSSAASGRSGQRGVTWGNVVRPSVAPSGSVSASMHAVEALPLQPRADGSADAPAGLAMPVPA